MPDYEKVATQLLRVNIPYEQHKRILVLTDPITEHVAKGFLGGLTQQGVSCELLVFEGLHRDGEEPPEAIAEAILSYDLVFCMTYYSLTHTQVRKDATERGVSFITMPGISEEMFEGGAIAADYERVERETLERTEALTAAAGVRIYTGESEVLDISLAGREGKASTGVYRGSGFAGNLPSGEAYIAPVEYAANGTYEVNGSIADIGLVEAPVRLTIKDGRLIDASGPQGARLLEMLGDGLGRQVAEFGIGTNHAAGVIGNILEDEKAYGTVHIAFGSNHTFGGTLRAGVHIDCVTRHQRIEFYEDQGRA